MGIPQVGGEKIQLFCYVNRELNKIYIIHSIKIQNHDCMSNKSIEINLS